MAPFPAGRLDARVLAGLALGFAGLVMLIKPSPAGGVDLLSAAVILGASMSWAWGSIYGQRAPQTASPLAATGMAMLGGGALLLLASLATGEPARFVLAAVSTRSLLSLGYLVVFGSLVAFTAYSWLLRVASPVLVSTYAYVNPLVAVFLGWIFADEPVTMGTLAAAAVILTGVALITSAPGHDQQDAGPVPGSDCAQSPPAGLPVPFSALRRAPAGVVSASLYRPNTFLNTSLSQSNKVFEKSPPRREKKKM